MRTTHGALTRKARKAWPYATVIAVLSDTSTDAKATYWLERAGEDAVKLGDTEGLARQTLNALVRERLDAVAIRWQQLVPLVKAELVRRGGQPFWLEDRFAGRRLAALIPPEATGPDYHVEMMHDDTLMDGDLNSIARQYVDHWEQSVKLAGKSNA